MSGRSSSCSVVQEENLVRRMRKTPGTPIKRGCQITPKKTGSKRCLFEVTSPTRSDDLGPVSPMSVSSCSSLNSFESPHFSPNGTFSTPPRTPKNDSTPTRRSPRHISRKLEVKSSLFPDLKLTNTKSKHSPKTPRTLLSKMLTPQSKVDSVEDIEEGIRSLSTPSTSRSRRKRPVSSDSFVAESPASVTESPLESEEECSTEKCDVPTKLGIKPISCESFYGQTQEMQKTKRDLLIDSLKPRKTLIRSESKESLSSNRSFVKGGNRQRTQSNDPRRQRSRSSCGNRRKAPHVGVWHNIKKPKQIKKLLKVEKPLISPQSRLAKMMSSPKKEEIKVKSKPLFQENPRKRIAHSKKRSRKEMEEDTIIDSFPNRLIKRKKLPTAQSFVHPAFEEKVESPKNLIPDPNKKFLKYGQTRKATFTLTENVKFKVSDGVMKLQTPKKRRKLYSGRKDIIEDFNDFEDGGDKEIEQSIQGILNSLHTEKENPNECKAQATTDPVAQIFHDLEGEGKTSLKTTANTQRSPLKSVTNLPTLIINDFETDEENSPMKYKQEKNSTEVSLAKTGNMVSYLTNILVNKEEVELNSPSAEEDIENTLPNESGKFYSLFYKQNWNKMPANNDGLNEKVNKKKTLVPDDQYLLDAGQSSIGIVTCKKCGVMYQAGDFADEATHNNFHNHLAELRFNGWANERVVGRYPNGKVIMILSCDPKTWWQKVSKVVDIVDQELGFPEASVKSLYLKTVYLYINEKSKQIAGCLIAEECRVGYRMFPPLEGVDVESCSKDPTPCKVGISRIWTALSHRRKGVATRMIDCLQRTFLFGDIVPIDQVAFSVPSPVGKLLAQKVTGRLDFLVYGFA